MGGLFHDPELEARKRVLAADCEIYRQTLKLEMHNLRLYGATVQRRLAVLRNVGPILSLAGPLAGMFLRARRRREQQKRSWLGKILLGWQLYRKYGRFIHTFVDGLMGRAPGLQTRYYRQPAYQRRSE